MDWTASAFGLLVTVTGGLFTIVILLVRRELDHLRASIAALQDKVHRLELEHVVLKPVINLLERNMEERADFMTGGAKA